MAGVYAVVCNILHTLLCCGDIAVLIVIIKSCNARTNSHYSVISMQRRHGGSDNIPFVCSQFYTEKIKQWTERVDQMLTPSSSYIYTDGSSPCAVHLGLWKSC